MTSDKHMHLADRTTFRIGGPADLFCTVERREDLSQAYRMARELGLEAYPLGEGSNVLASDEEIKKAVIHLTAHGVTYTDRDDEIVEVTVEGGMRWDDLVTETVAKGLWGLENLAAIPGTVGAAPVQNIGAYGREVMDVIETVEAYDPERDTFMTFTHDDCGFSYRDSRFKRTPGMFITRVAFGLSRTPRPELAYLDLQKRLEAGADLSTPARIAAEVRAIRANKFPDLSVYGTAGSFFKNPLITREEYAALRETYPVLPGFEVGDTVKIPLAWILDHGLSLRGYARGPVHLFERQPLVIVAERGATARDVDALADEVAERVHAATGIVIEREVQALK